MEQAAETIHRRSAGLSDTAHGTVRLLAGEAMTAFLARHLPRLRHNMRCIEIELVASHMLANLSRREADLLIRDEVPDVASIVTRKLGRAAYAVYGNAELARGRRCRITLPPRRQRTCSAAHRCAAGEGDRTSAGEGTRGQLGDNTRGSR